MRLLELLGWCFGLYGFIVLVAYFFYRARLKSQGMEPPEQMELPRLVVNVDRVDAQSGNGKVHNAVVIRRSND